MSPDTSAAGQLAEAFAEQDFPRALEVLKAHGLDMSKRGVRSTLDIAIALLRSMKIRAETEKSSNGEQTKRHQGKAEGLGAAIDLLEKARNT